MPTGGVAPTEENMKGWFDAGVTCVGLGSQLISKEVLASENMEELKAAVKNAIEIVQKLKK